MIFARTASSAAASVPRAHKSDASQKTLGSLLHKTWQIRMIGTAGEEGSGLKYSMLQVVCVMRSTAVSGAGVLFICLKDKLQKLLK